MDAGFKLFCYKCIKKTDNLIQQAQQLHLPFNNLIKSPTSKRNKFHELQNRKKIWDNWKNKIDDGVENYAPKFMMPNNYEYLMRYSKRNDDDTIKKSSKLH